MTAFLFWKTLLFGVSLLWSILGVTLLVRKKDLGIEVIVFIASAWSAFYLLSNYAG
jgi:hypothetical protein